MKLYFLSLMVLFSAILFSCKNQENKNAQLNATSSHSIVLGDTIFLDTAPKRISRKIRKMSNGNLIITSFDDVFLYDGNTFSPIPLPKDLDGYNAFDAIEDSKGNFWIASTTSGLYKYDGSSFEHFTTKNGLVSDRVTSIYERKNGELWVSTMEGISVIKENDIQNITVRDGLTSGNVNTIIESNDGKMWIGTRGDINIIDSQVDTIGIVRNVYEENFRNAWAFLEDPSGKMWMAGQSGIWRLDNGRYRPISVEFNNSLHLDSKGNVWSTTPRGKIYNYESSTLQNQSPGAKEIYTYDKMLFNITEYKADIFFISGLDGVMKYDGAKMTPIKEK